MKYSCPNGCKLPRRRKQLIELNDGTYCFGYKDFPFCPMCGSLMPYSLQKIRDFFDVYRLHPALKNARDLVCKSEFQSAAREAFVTVENSLKNKSGLDLHGFDLVTKALSFEIDQKTKELTKAPLIALNELKDETDRNEQNGIRYMLMGFFLGPRNIYQHNHVGSGPTNVISILTQASFFLDLLDGKCIKAGGIWLTEYVSYREIFDKMPKKIDRWKLKRILKRKHRKKNSSADDDLW